MEDNLWVEGSIELLKHGLEHIVEGKEFDLRIALISIDNAIELAIKIYLSKNRRSLNISRKEFNNAKKNFVNLLDTLSKYSSHKVSEELLDAIEHYHKIRNNLYHDGIGISVEKKYAEIYSVLAINLINQLFDIDVKQILEEKEDFVLYKKYGEFMASWNNIEHILKKLSKNLIDTEKHPYTLDKIISVLNENNILPKGLTSRIYYLNHNRNLIVHQTKDFPIEEMERNIGFAHEVYNALLLI